MKSCAFEYVRPKDVSQAISLLKDENAKAAAGTQSLGPMLNLRIVQPALLVDLRHLEELKSVCEDKESVTLGACVTTANIEDGRLPGRGLQTLSAVATHIAYRAVRNRGTIGGSLVHADPAADWPSTLTLLGAVALIAGPRGRREVPVDKFITGLFETVLAHDEILVALRIPKRSAAARFGYWKFCRKAGEFPQAIGAALHDPERNEFCAVIGATGSAPYVAVESKKIIGNAEKSVLLAAVDAAGLGRDAYNRQLHAVALRRAVEQLAA